MAFPSDLSRSTRLGILEATRPTPGSASHQSRPDGWVIHRSADAALSVSVLSNPFAWVSGTFLLLLSNLRLSFLLFFFSSTSCCVSLFHLLLLVLGTWPHNPLSLSCVSLGVLIVMLLLLRFSL